MFRFAYPDFLWLLLLIPVALILFILNSRWKKKAISLFGNSLQVNRLMQERSEGKNRLKFTLMALAYFFLIIGLSNPQIGSKYEEIKRQGIDVVIALDVSNSMRAEDIRPNRLERAKRAIDKLLDKFVDDRIGIVVFAGEAHLQLPFTPDYAAAKLFLANVSPESISTQGTAIGEAIETSVMALPREDKRSRAIIIISDGESHDDNAVAAAAAAKKAGILVYTLGIGSEQGAPVPDVSEGIVRGYKKDADGNPVISRMNPTMLTEIANAGGGSFVQASANDIGLEDLFLQINSMEKSDFGSKVFTNYTDRFQLFLIVASLLLLTEVLISERRSKLAKRLNIFGNRKRS